MGKSSPIISETEQHYTIKKPSLRYLDLFVKMKCAPDLLAAGLFPNAKEITESMAMLHAVKKYIKIDLNNKTVNLVVIGDGSTPRTAALFAFMTSWICTSVDPALKPSKDICKIERLYLHPFKGEEFMGNADIVIFPHAHVCFDKMPYNIKMAKFVVAMPCCSPYCNRQQLWGSPISIHPNLRYTDWGVHSPQREILIWRS